jgi:hypothetical protein
MDFGMMSSGLLAELVLLVLGPAEGASQAPPSRGAARFQQGAARGLEPGNPLLRCAFIKTKV